MPPLFHTFPTGPCYQKTLMSENSYPNTAGAKQ
jgi:hypothetical protein